MLIIISVPASERPNDFGAQIQKFFKATSEDRHEKLQ